MKIVMNSVKYNLQFEAVCVISNDLFPLVPNKMY